MTTGECVQVYTHRDPVAMVTCIKAMVLNLIDAFQLLGTIF